MRAALVWVDTRGFRQCSSITLNAMLGKTHLLSVKHTWVRYGKIAYDKCPKRLRREEV